MGTRSVVAIPYARKTGWRGRYIHWDGYPSGVGRTLHKIVRRDGRDKAVRVLVEDHAGWSSVNGEADPKVGLGMDDGRFEAVPGYGTAYTTTKLNIFGEKNYQQARKSDWIRHDGDDCGTEYAYVLRANGMVVLARRYADGTPAVGWFGLPAAPVEEGGKWDTLAWVPYDAEWPEELS